MRCCLRVVVEEPMIVSTILPDMEMIPEVHTSKPSFLMRRSKSPSPPKDIEIRSRQRAVLIRQQFQPRNNQVSSPALQNLN